MDAGFPVSFLYGVVVVALLACLIIRARKNRKHLDEASDTIATPPGSRLISVNCPSFLHNSTNASTSQATGNRADPRRTSRSSQRAAPAGASGATVATTLELPPPIYQAASLDRRVTSTSMPPPPPPPSYSRSTTATQNIPHSVIQMEELVPPQTPIATRRIFLSSASPSLPESVFAPTASV